MCVATQCKPARSGTTPFPALILKDFVFFSLAISIKCASPLPSRVVVWSGTRCPNLLPASTTIFFERLAYTWTAATMGKLPSEHKLVFKFRPRWHVGFTEEVGGVQGA